MLTNRSKSDPELLESVRVWAGLLAAESRGQEWVRASYVVPETILRVARELDALRADGLICLIGCQGIGKSSALMAFHQGIVPGMPRHIDSILLKWRRDQDLHANFGEQSQNIVCISLRVFD